MKLAFLLFCNLNLAHDVGQKNVLCLWFHILLLLADFFPCLVTLASFFPLQVAVYLYSLWWLSLLVGWSQATRSAEGSMPF